MRPGKIVNVLVALLQSTLRAAEVSAGNGAIGMNNARSGGVVRRGTDKTGEDKARFIDQVGRNGCQVSNIEVGVVVGGGGEIVRGHVGCGLDNHIAGTEAV